MCIRKTDAPCCAAETNIEKQLHFNKKINKENSTILQLLSNYSSNTLK